MAAHVEPRPKPLPVHMHGWNLAPSARALLTATGAIPVPQVNGTGVTGLVRKEQPPAGPTASNRGCLHENARVAFLVQSAMRR